MASGTGAMFSYAQAAKGRAPLAPSPSSVTSPASSENGSKEVPTDIGSAQKRSKQVSVQSEDEFQSVTPAQSDAEYGGSTRSREETITEINNQESHITTKATDIGGMVPSTNAEIEIASSEPETSQQERANDNEQLVRSLGSAESAEIGDADKGKEIDDDWEKVSLPSIAAERELKAAPPPPVNIWLQRKEAQEAKAKEQAGPRSTLAGSVPKQRSRVTASVDESRRQTNSRETTSEKEPNPTPRRVNSGNRTAQDRKDQMAPQASPKSLPKQNDKVAASPPPPTADASSWPTPDTTLGDERRRSVVPEKGDKLDTKANSQKKSWIQMPFVPTAKFETQLPPAATARRGGRPSNRGRDLAGRGGNVSAGAHAGEKADAGAMGPPPLPSKADHDRGRKFDAPRNVRASSVPAQSQRVPSRDSNDPPIHQASVTTAAKSAASSTTPVEVQSTFVTGNTNAVNQNDQTSRASSRKPAQTLNSSHRADVEPKATSQSPSHNGQSFEDNSRQTTQPERQKGTAQDLSRSSAEHAEHGNHAHGREWSRGKIDVSREKTESWRSSREGRPDRGRGSYRGRGNHPGYNQHGSSHTYTPSLSQNGLESSKSISSHDSRSRQASQPYNQTQTMGNNRNSSRSQSTPLAMMQQTFYSPMQGYPQALSPSELNFGNYPQQAQNGSIMGAMPYNEQLNSYALISMVITQLEYYFSIDNLCKDMFLRKHMDSQGFVFLSVIAGFKRIQTLTEGQMTHEHFRSVCQQVRNVEFAIGEDGEDKLRSRENWRDFVLPMEERVPAARNDGPIVHAQNQPLSPQMTANYTRANGTLTSPPAHLNGFAEPFIQPVAYSPVTTFDGVADYTADHSDPQSHEQARRPSTTSPFSKVQSSSGNDLVRSSSYMTNGRHPSVSNNLSDENSFPDEKIAELKVVVRDPSFEAPVHDNGDGSSNNLGLRGGAGSPSQLDHFRNMHLGQNVISSSALDADQPPYWTKDGEIAKIPVGPGFVHEDYSTLHDKAISQRHESHFDGALSVLYSFWSSFLVSNFNASMYREFVDLATGDASAGHDDGKTHLLRYYESLLTSRLPISERIAMDVVAMAREENGNRRPTYQKLRSAWRNGATNLKTRKRLGAILTMEEKTEFDRSV